jgi:hypothetical protein
LAAFDIAGSPDRRLVSYAAAGLRLALFSTRSQ